MMTIRQLRADRDHMILNADKGIALVLVDRQDYIKMVRKLLEDTATYRPIQTDPTSKHKAKLINILKNIKAETGMSDNIYRRMYPTGASSPKFYGLLKIHKKDIPLRPIISSIGSVTYGVAKELARILKPLVGKTSHHVNNSKDL